MVKPGKPLQNCFQHVIHHWEIIQNNPAEPTFVELLGNLIKMIELHNCLLKKWLGHASKPSFSSKTGERRVIESELHAKMLKTTHV